MNDIDKWQRNNEEYLASALAWLRLRLTWLAEQHKDEEDSVIGRRPFWQRSQNGSGKVTKEQLEDAGHKLKTVQCNDPPPALILLAQRFGMSTFEQNTLLLCAAMELDTRIPALCAQAQGDPNRTYPTFALAMALFDEPAWDVLSPERPLRFWRLIEVVQPAAQPLTTSPLRADEHIVNYIKGLNYLDDRLVPLLAPFDAILDGHNLPNSQRKTATRVLHHLEGASQNDAALTVQLLGADSLSKQLVAQQVATSLELQLYRMGVDALPTQSADLEIVARLWTRDSILLPVALYLDASETENSESQNKDRALQRFITRSHGIFLIAGREILSGLGPTSAAVEVEKPYTVEQKAIWTESLPEQTNGIPAILAGQFNLNEISIRKIANLSFTEASSNGNHIDECVWRACLMNTRPRMDLLAQRLEPKATWDDIVLPPEVESLLRQMADQVRDRSTVYDNWGFRQRMNRGLGITALFSGDSGTGKTMAAEVLANELKLNLYRIDLSQVVSKYIGETEKNLRRLFDAAEDGGAILFFDEADALFGKRSEVKDSHDRYANIEINYLLQRMEAFRGLAILASNMRSALDAAFIRRLRFIVNFPFPDILQREMIWRKVFPPETPIRELDYMRLSSWSLTGGSIHNIALHTAFLAAHAKDEIKMPLLLQSARTEFQKMELPFVEADFR